MLWNKTYLFRASNLFSLIFSRIIVIAENELTGPIPTEVGSLTTLEIYLIAENGLTGSIPTEVGSLIKLLYLYLCK